MTSRLARTCLAVLAGAALAGTACTADSSARLPTRVEFEHRLVERHGITRAQARCAAGYAFGHYTDAEVIALYRIGLTGVSLDRWSEFGQGLLACSLHDQLVENSPSGP